MSLPPSPAPRGDYAPAVRVGHLVHTAGMTPRRNGELLLRGVVGAGVTLTDAADAAAVAAGNALSAAAVAAGGLARVARVVRMTVYVACAEGVTALSAVADGASAELSRHLGSRGLAARAAVGVRALPDGAPVEVELTVAVGAPPPPISAPPT